MSHATYVLGNVRDVLATIPDGSIDLVLTSPPFLALRSYLPPDHPDKHREIGAEPGPAEFIDTLLGLTAEWRRVLAPHGSIAVELGDTYAGSGGAGGDYDTGAKRQGPKFGGSALADRKNKVLNAQGQRMQQGPGWPLDKSLTMVPELYRVALAYGLNPLTGQPSPAGQWRARNVVRWCRPNPPVGALGDKVRPATSDMVIACTSRTRYFDLDAIREPANPAHKRPSALKRAGIPGRTDQTCNPIGPDGQRVISNPAGAPPLDHWWADPDDFDQDAWLVSTEAYRGSHYATWPRKLLTRPILAMCPERVCTVCGEPSRRIVAENPDYEGRAGGPTHNNAEQGASLKGFSHKAYAPPKFLDTGAWSDCGHGDSWRPGIVLDPFAGSGTTLEVATGHGRHAIGIDIDERNVDLARERVGGLLLDAVTLDEYAARQQFQEVAAAP